MGKKQKSDQVIRRVVLGREYKIYSMKVEKGVPTLNELESITSTKRPNEKDMCEKHKVDKVIIVAESVITGYYGVPIDKFMELATLIEEKKKALSEDEQEEKEAETGEEVQE
jgi:hypothetical protein